jgi:hypothetical protein
MLDHASIHEAAWPKGRLNWGLIFCVFIIAVGIVLPSQTFRRHPEVLASRCFASRFGEPRRMATGVYAAILRDAAQVRGSSG